MKKKIIPTQTTLPSASTKSIEGTVIKKPLLTRKRQIDDHLFQRPFHYVPASRPKGTVGLLKKNSFDDLKTQILDNACVGEIKYLSPHFIRAGNFASPPQKKEQDVKQKFVRKKGNIPECIKERFANKNQPQTPPYKKHETFNVEISLESAVTKGSDVTEVEGSSRNWLTLETQNQTLKKEKAELEKEVLALHTLLNKSNISVPKNLLKQGTYLRKISESTNSSSSSLDLALQAKIKELEDREDELLNQLNQQKMSIEHLLCELKEMRTKFECERDSKIELLKVIEIMKQEYNQERNAFESIAVKQDILQRRRAQYDNAKLIASKADRQRQTLKKTLGQYKQKMNLLAQIIAKKKEPKPKLDQSLDLSLDLSTSFDCY